MDGAGNLYIADRGNNRIRKVTAATGIISTVAGNGTANFAGDGGSATLASLYGPISVTVDGAGNLYIADTDNNRIREVTAATGIISTVAGNGQATFAGDGGPATSASAYASGVGLDGAGNLYIGDQYNQRIRKVSAKGGISFPTATAAGSADTTDGIELLTLNNIGNTALTLSSMQNNIGSYVMANPMSGGCSTAVSVAAGASCLLGEQFQPAAGSSGVVPGSLVITDNSLNVSGSVQYVPLLGTTSAGSINVSATTTSVTAGTASTSITVIVGYSGTTADTGAITLTVNGSASGVGTPTCTSKGGHENCAYPYTGTALAIAGSYPVVASVAADSTDNYAAGSASATLTVSPVASHVSKPGPVIVALPKLGPSVR